MVDRLDTRLMSKEGTVLKKHQLMDRAPGMV